MALAMVLGIALAPQAGAAQTSQTTGGAPATRSDARAEAQRLFKRGVDLARQERWREATEAFARSRAMVERPSTVFNLAGALYRLGSLVRARDAFQDFLRLSDPKADADNRAEARRMLGVLKQSIAKLILRVGPDDAEVQLNSRTVEGTGELRVLALDPGDHTLQVSAEGFTARRIPVSLREGERMEKTIRLEEIPKPEPAPLTSATDPMPVRYDRADDGGGSVFASPWFWVATGLVIAGGVTTAYLLTRDPDIAPPDAGNTGAVLIGLTADP